MTMDFSLSNLLRMVLQSIQRPQEGATTVLSLGPPAAAVWQMLGVVVILTVLSSQAGFILMPAEPNPLTAPLVASPLTTTFIQFSLILVMVVSVHTIGRALGGEGRFDETLLLITWLMFIMFVIQIVQLVTLLIIPPLASLIAFGSLVLFMWLLVNFVATLHGFPSLAMVAIGIVLSAIAVIFALSIVLSIIGFSVPGS